MVQGQSGQRSGQVGSGRAASQGLNICQVGNGTQHLTWDKAHDWARIGRADSANGSGALVWGLVRVTPGHGSSSTFPGAQDSPDSLLPPSITELCWASRSANSGVQDRQRMKTKR